MSRRHPAYEPAAAPSDDAIARHARRIRDHLDRTGLGLLDLGHLDPAAQVDPLTATRRLAGALARLNAEQQAAVTAAGSTLPASPLRWGDRPGLQARFEYYRATLLLRHNAAAVLALTPLPVAWVAQTFDMLQGRSLHRRVCAHFGDEYVRPGDQRHVRMTLSVIAFAADALAGTGELPAPCGIWRWLGPRPASLNVPAFEHRWCRSALTEEHRIARQAYWDAAAELHGADWHGEGPLQRHVPGWDRLDLLTAVLGVRYAVGEWRRLGRELGRGVWRHPFYWPRSAAERSRRDLLADARRQFNVQHPGHRIPVPAARGNGPMWRWLAADDVTQRCRWRAYTLAGSDERLVDRLERRLLRDVLARYVLRTVPPERTTLPAQAAWRDALFQVGRRDRRWRVPPLVADGSAAHLVMIGYGPGRRRADPGLRHAGPDELAAAAALLGDEVFA